MYPEQPSSRPSLQNHLKEMLRQRRTKLLILLLLLLILGGGILARLVMTNPSRQTTKSPSASTASASGESAVSQPSTSTTKAKPKDKSQTSTPKTSGGGSAGTTSGSWPSSGSSGGSGSTPVTLHYTTNIGSNQSLALSLGFNLFDVGGSQNNPSGVNTTVNNLPTGVKALVWVGNLDNTNCTPGFSYTQFTAQVDALKNNSRVFGYYLADEPHPSICPSAASDILARADYIKAHAPNQKSFILVLDGSNMCGANLGCEYAALAPANTHVDYIGIDPYPCHYAADQVTPVPCDNNVITQRVTSAMANGIPLSAIVPTFQAFGQTGRTDGKSVYYRLPSSSELSNMLNVWAELVPNPAFDYSYTFGVQCSTSCPAPQAISNTPDIQSVLFDHNQ